jgi:hypothetical protein
MIWVFDLPVVRGTNRKNVPGSFTFLGTKHKAIHPIKKLPQVRERLYCSPVGHLWPNRYRPTRTNKMNQQMVPTEKFSPWSFCQSDRSRFINRLTGTCFVAVTWASFLSLVLMGLSSSGAPTIWTGAQMTFTKTALADPTQAVNQDRLTPNVWITRGNSQGLYNAKTETSFSHSSSPADTEWANGTTANYSSLSYSDWNTWAKGVNASPPSTVGVNAVLHLKSEDIYIDIKFTSWGSSLGGGGAFSYVRSTPATGNTPPSVSITNPTSGATFIAPANVTIQASASDSDGTVTNVQFFDGATSLGSVTSSPHQVVVGLAVGSHSLTAVASDNLGATTTSSPPVTVTVNTNAFPQVAITNPTNGAVLIAPATFTVQATASDDGSISQVQFFNNATPLATDTTFPYEVTITNLAAGAYTLAAVATDNLNATATNTISITVNDPPPPPVQITVNPIFQQGAFGFSFLTQTGFTYVVEFTTNLSPVNWLTLTNFIGDGSVAHVTDSTATNSGRYYRVGAH